jgi:hypothetical protein
MATVASQIIGPVDHGRAMRLREFIRSEFEEEFRYELARGVVVVTTSPTSSMA